MRARSVWMLCAGLLVAPAVPASSTTTTLIGTDAVSAFFDPNLTHPSLQLGGAGSTENSGGVAIFGSASFEMRVNFLSSSPPDFYDNILLTAALDADLDYAGLVVSVTFAGSQASLAFADFIDAETFGLPFPPGGITGIANGAGDFLSLNGALVGGFDLGTSLERGVSNPLLLQVAVTGISNPDQIVRFDVFGQNADDIVIGNNPNSGAAGFRVPGGSFLVPEPRATLLAALGLLIAGVATRRRTQVPIQTR
jgi:hypothetical protein